MRRLPRQCLAAVRFVLCVAFVIRVASPHPVSAEVMSLFNLYLWYDVC
jgi:hypothetical protein